MLKQSTLHVGPIADPDALARHASSPAATLSPGKSASTFDPARLLRMPAKLVSFGLNVSYL
jgi:hypothetical protein